MTEQVSALPVKNVAQAALSSGTMVVVGAAKVYGLTINNTKASAQFIQLHNVSATPADAAVPVWCGTIPASTSQVIDFGFHGMDFSLGVYVCNSSTSATKTIGSADCQFFVRSVAP